MECRTRSRGGPYRCSNMVGPLPNELANYRLDVMGGGSQVLANSACAICHYYPRIDAGFYVLQRGKYVRCDDLNSDRVYRQERRERTGSIRISGRHYGSFEMKFPSKIASCGRA